MAYWPTRVLQFAAKRRQPNKLYPQFRMWMPNMPLTMVSARNATANRPAFAIFRTPPKMTKHEIKEYLTKIYDLPVKKVNTMNYEGKRKRVMSQSGMAYYYKYKDFKKAVVTFDETMQDVGMGMRIPELEEEEEVGGADDLDAMMDADDEPDHKKLPK